MSGELGDKVGGSILNPLLSAVHTAAGKVDLLKEDVKSYSENQGKVAAETSREVHDFITAQSTLATAVQDLQSVLEQLKVILGEGKLALEKKEVVDAVKEFRSLADTVVASNKETLANNQKLLASNEKTLASNEKVLAAYAERVGPRSVGVGETPRRTAANPNLQETYQQVIVELNHLSPNNTLAWQEEDQSLDDSNMFSSSASGGADGVFTSTQV